MSKKAQESAAVKRAREKLKKRFAEEDEKTSERAIEQMKQAIRIWLARHAEDRVNLMDKTIKLFDENKHSAKTKSKFVGDLLKRIKHDSPEPEDTNQLRGRIQQ